MQERHQDTNSRARHEEALHERYNINDYTGSKVKSEGREGVTKERKQRQSNREMTTKMDILSTFNSTEYITHFEKMKWNFKHTGRGQFDSRIQVEGVSRLCVSQNKRQTVEIQYNINTF